MDVLPPLAAQEFGLIHTFLKTFMGFGYQPVTPPLAEYAPSLLKGAGEATSHHVFQVSDPVSSQMLAIRADMTGQVARIATESLKSAKRPLRLCYAGYTLRTTAESLKTRRQHTQVGIERFGDATAQSTAEVLAIACHALTSNALNGITIDLHYPCVLEALLKPYPAKQHADIRDAVRLKDPARLHALGAENIAEMMRHAGPAQTVLKKLAASPHAEVKKAATDLSALVNALESYKLGASITIDLLDLSGYGYYHGVGYALYWNKASIEAGRGGCYRTASGEEAVGFTLYLNELLEHLPVEKAPKTKAIAYGTSLAEAQALQTQGFVTVFE
jgi:ATP phosphoribosyltransferase regulatory subunit